MTYRLRACPSCFLKPLMGLGSFFVMALVGANDFPTVDRVLYVQECMRNHPGPYYEMVNKCSCALDRLAAEINFDDYVNMVTIVNAVSIGGERGSEMRDNETLKPHIARYRALQAKVSKACFIGPQ
jgi:hypothetical protein